MDQDITIAPQPPTLPPGSPILGWIDDYEVIRELGRGGYGSVYLVRHKKNKSEYAVKGLPPDVSQNSNAVESIEENFRLIGDLNHTHIVAMHPLMYPKSINFYDKSKDNLRVKPGEPLVVMSYARGITLSEWRKRQPNGRVAPKKAAEIVRQIAEALDEAHRQKILHRDIKPSNVMIDEHVESVDCKILDFGIAAAIPAQIWHSRQESVRDVCGTPMYMAPEQWCGEDQGPATDQYALAVLYYELVTGKVPFQDAFDTGDHEAAKSAVLSRRPDLREISRSARKAVRRALAKKYGDRFLTCAAFAAALKGNPWPMCLGLICFLVLVVGSAIWLWDAKNPSPEPVPPDPIIVPPDPKPVLPDPKPVPPDPKPVLPDPKPVPPEPDPIPQPTPILHEHRYGAWVTVVSPGCETAGRQERTCTAGGCSHPPHVEASVLQPLGHDWGNWTTVTPPQIGIKGTEKCSCSRCKREIMRDIRALDPPPPPPHVHRYEWHTTVAPGCETVGTQTLICVASGCSTPVSSETKPLPALGHDWSAWLDAVPAKIGVAGVKERQCRRCQLKDSKPIQPLMPDVNRLLQEAKSFAGKGRNKARSRRERYESWRQCLETTEGILQIKPGNWEAGRLKDQAENAMTNLREHQSQATQQNTLRGTRNSNGIEFLNHR